MTDDRYVHSTARRFHRTKTGIRYEVVIVPFLRRADGSIGRRKARPVYFTASTAEHALELADEWMRINVPEAGR